MASRDSGLGENKVEQLLFWDMTLESDIDLGTEIQLLREKQENLRKGLFQRYSDLCKEVRDLKGEIILLKMNSRGK
jgi:hypothetical protein